MTRHPPHPRCGGQRTASCIPKNLQGISEIQTGSLISGMCLSLASCGPLGRFLARLGTHLHIRFLSSLSGVCVVGVFGIEVDAVEMVRRSERAFGVAIRKGQEAGEIATPRDGAAYRDDLSSVITKVSPGARTRDARDLALPSQFAQKDELTQVYAMTDNVSDEEFDV